MNAPSPRPFANASHRRPFHRLLPLLAAGMGLLGLPLTGSAFTFTLTTIYTFNTATDGNLAYPSLIEGSDGRLYGTNSGGGKFNHGTAFAVEPSGKNFQLLANYPNTAGGSTPFSGLLQARDGNFYGTTNAGGDNGFGVLYQLTPDRTLTYLAAFNNGDPGANPNGSLLEAADGSLYGTARYGGSDNFGTIFRATLPTKALPLGTLAAFAEITGGTAGTYPESDLIQATDGNFYGTTYSGGTSSNGTFFQVTPAGVYTVLYSFSGDTDGGGPLRGVVQGPDGAFYGVATTGGTFASGTIFRISLTSTTSTLTVLYTFAPALGDGTHPYGNLFLASDGNFYGTTYDGGTNMVGTIYKVTPTGAFTTVYDFANGTDGGFPTGGLTEAGDGKLYGTTAGQSGSPGTVFRADVGLSAQSPHPAYPIPASARTGDTILIKGNYFVGTTGVTFAAASGKTVAATDVTVMSKTILSLVVPTGAVTGDIVVTNAIGSGTTGKPLTITNVATPTPTPTPKPTPTPTPAPKVSVVATDPVATKTAGNNGVYKITREGGEKTKALTILFKSKGTAVRGTDYNLVTQGETLAAVTNSVTFPAGVTKLKVKVVPVPSSVASPDETVVFQIKPGAGYKLGAPAKAVVEIAGNTGGS